MLRSNTNATVNALLNTCVFSVNRSFLKYHQHLFLYSSSGHTSRCTLLCTSICTLNRTENDMTIQRILAENTVSVSEMRKHPADFFTDQPVAVLNKNQPVGYMLGRELFESMVDLIRQHQPQETFTAKFQPNIGQLKAVAASSSQFLSSAKDDELGNFVE